MIEVGTVPSEYTNLTIRDISVVGRAKQSDGATVAEASMSFGDFIDMINPLQHIPVVSSLYRAIAGDEINPVSRIAGDALYGGVMGIASAGLAAIGAISDEVVVASNNGRSLTGTVVAALSGSADAPKTVVASKTETTPTADLPKAPIVAAESAKAPQYLAMPTTKLPFGGVMDTATLGNAQENQTLALALAGQRDALQSQRALRNSRFEPPAQTPTEATAESASPSAPTTKELAAVGTPPMGPEAQTAMQALLQELAAMKAIKNYQSAAEITPFASGGLVNGIN